MTLEELASIGGLISSIAVLVSLIYLAQQTRQNVKHARALIQQARIERVIDLQMRFADAELSTAWLAASGDEATPEAVRRRQFVIQCTTYYQGWDDTLSQYHDGLVSKDQFARFRRQMVLLMRSSPAARAFFAAYVQNFEPDRLVEFVTGLIAEAEAAGPLPLPPKGSAP